MLAVATSLWAAEWFMRKKDAVPVGTLTLAKLLGELDERPSRMCWSRQSG